MPSTGTSAAVDDNPFECIDPVFKLREDWDLRDAEKHEEQGNRSGSEDGSSFLCIDSQLHFEFRSLLYQPSLAVESSSKQEAQDDGFIVSLS